MEVIRERFDEKIRNSNLRLMAKKPTDSELEILTILWKRGPMTVRDMVDQLHTDRGYTTILKFLQIMHKKGLVERSESDRAHVYRAVNTVEDAQQNLLHDLVHRVFGGSSQKLVLRAISDGSPSKEEIEEIKNALAELEAKL